MKPLLFALLILISVDASAETQVATLINYESTAIRPDNNDSDNVTSMINASLEYTSPENISVYGGFSFILGETFESAVNVGARFYNATPALQAFTGVPTWSFIGGGGSLYDSFTFYPEAGFRMAISNTARLDVNVKLLNSSDETYDQHLLFGVGLTF